MPEKISAGGLLEKLGLKRKKPAEAPAAGILPVVPAETPAALETPAAPPPAPVLESAPAVAPEPAATEAPLAQEPAPAGGFPDWLSAAPFPAESVSALLPEPEAPAVEEPAVGTPVAPSIELLAPVAPAVEVKTDPLAVNREFNRYMEKVRWTLAIVKDGIALTPDEQKDALIAVAKANSLLSKLPEDVLKSVLLMRAVAANNPDFSRNDFQIEMLAAMDVIKTGMAAKG